MTSERLNTPEKIMRDAIREARAHAACEAALGIRLDPPEVPNRLWTETFHRQYQKLRYANELRAAERGRQKLMAALHRAACEDRDLVPKNECCEGTCHHCDGQAAA